MSFFKKHIPFVHCTLELRHLQGDCNLTLLFYASRLLNVWLAQALDCLQYWRYRHDFGKALLEGLCREYARRRVTADTLPGKWRKAVAKLKACLH